MENEVMENEVMDVEVVENNEIEAETTDLVPMSTEVVTNEEEVSTKDTILVGGLVTLAGIGAAALIKGSIKLAKAGIKKIKDRKSQQVAAEAINDHAVEVEIERNKEEPEQTSSEGHTRLYYYKRDTTE